MNKKNVIALIVLLAVIAAAVLLLRGAEDGGNGPEQTTGTTETTAPVQTEESAKPSETEEPTETTDSTEPTETTEPTDSTVTLPQRAEADYEHWLSAAMVIGISMEYPDFELEGIYAASSTELGQSGESLGAVILFTSGGEALAIHSTPLSAERSEPGSRDLAAESLGFAAFDAVSADQVDVSGMTPIDMEELGELIDQSLLVSIYTH